MQADVFPDVCPVPIGPAHEFFVGELRVVDHAHDSTDEIIEHDYLGREHAVPVSGDAIARFRYAMTEVEPSE